MKKKTWLFVILSLFALESSIFFTTLDARGGRGGGSRRMGGGRGGFRGGGGRGFHHGGGGRNRGWGRHRGWHGGRYRGNWGWRSPFYIGNPCPYWDPYCDQYYGNGLSFGISI